jgi:polyisoprenoid-binding protein YceI
MEAGSRMSFFSRSAPRLALPRSAYAAVVFALLLTAPACAQTTVFDADPAQSRVEFTLDAFLHTVHGNMKLTRGRLEFDQATGTASGRFVVDSRSAGTGNSGRDKKMHESVLESAKFPEIAFAPMRVEGQIPAAGKGSVQLRGVISIHGSEHEVTIPVLLDMSGTQWSGDAEFPVPYAMWGLKNPSTLFLRVKDEVLLRVHLAGSFAPASH